MVPRCGPLPACLSSQPARSQSHSRPVPLPTRNQHGVCSFVSLTLRTWPLMLGVLLTPSSVCGAHRPGPGWRPSCRQPSLAQALRPPPQTPPRLLPRSRLSGWRPPPQPQLRPSPLHQIPSHASAKTNGLSFSNIGGCGRSFENSGFMCSLGAGSIDILSHW